MAKSLISIIVPAYKVEPYIRKCVESIICQTYRQIEVILVDDGSPDNCGVICDEYAQKDDRITVIHKKNGGLSSARNAGLDIATGEYLMFVDGDDWVEPEFCKTALKLAEKNDVQMVSFGYNMVFANADGTLTCKKKRLSPPEGFMDASEAVRHMIQHDYVMNNHVWNKLYKRSLWGDARFEEGRVWEDQGVTYLMAIKAGKVYVSNTVLYNYIQRNNSIMGSMMVSPKAITDIFDLWKNRLAVIRRHCPENEHLQLLELGDLAVMGFIYIHPNGEYGNTLTEMETFLSVNRNRLLCDEGKPKTKLKLQLYYNFRPLLFLWKYARTAKNVLRVAS